MGIAESKFKTFYKKADNQTLSDFYLFFTTVINEKPLDLKKIKAINKDKTIEKLEMTFEQFKEFFDLPYDEINKNFFQIFCDKGSSKTTFSTFASKLLVYPTLTDHERTLLAYTLINTENHDELHFEDFNLLINAMFEKNNIISQLIQQLQEMLFPTTSIPLNLEDFEKYASKPQNYIDVIIEAYYYLYPAFFCLPFFAKTRKHIPLIQDAIKKRNEQIEQERKRKEQEEKEEEDGEDLLEKKLKEIEEKKKHKNEKKEDEEGMDFNYDFGGKKDPLFEKETKDWYDSDDEENEEEKEDEHKKKVNIKIEMKAKNDNPATAKKVKAITFAFGQKPAKKINLHKDHKENKEHEEEKGEKKRGEVYHNEEFKKTLKLIEKGKLDDAMEKLQECYKKAETERIKQLIKSYFYFCEIIEHFEIKGDCEEGLLLHSFGMILPLLKPHRKLMICMAIEYMKKMNFCIQSVKHFVELFDENHSIEIKEIKSTCWKCGKERVDLNDCECGENLNIVCSRRGIQIGGKDVWKCSNCKLLIEGTECILCGHKKEEKKEEDKQIETKPVEEKKEEQINEFGGFTNDFGFGNTSMSFDNNFGSFGNDFSFGTNQVETQIIADEPKEEEKEKTNANELKEEKVEEKKEEQNNSFNNFSNDFGFDMKPTENSFASFSNDFSFDMNKVETQIIEEPKEEEKKEEVPVAPVEEKKEENVISNEPKEEEKVEEKKEENNTFGGFSNDFGFDMKPTENSFTSFSNDFGSFGNDFSFDTKPKEEEKVEEKKEEVPIEQPIEEKKEVEEQPKEEKKEEQNNSFSNFSNDFGFDMKPMNNSFTSFSNDFSFDTKPVEQPKEEKVEEKKEEVPVAPVEEKKEIEEQPKEEKVEEKKEEQNNSFASFGDDFGFTASPKPQTTNTFASFGNDFGFDLTPSNQLNDKKEEQPKEEEKKNENNSFASFGNDFGFDFTPSPKPKQQTNTNFSDFLFDMNTPREPEEKKEEAPIAPVEQPVEEKKEKVPVEQKETIVEEQPKEEKKEEQNNSFGNFSNDFGFDMKPMETQNTNQSTSSNTSFSAFDDFFATSSNPSMTSFDNSNDFGFGTITEKKNEPEDDFIIETEVVEETKNTYDHDFIIEDA